jgi:hypothetical protein
LVKEPACDPHLATIDADIDVASLPASTELTGVYLGYPANGSDCVYNRFLVREINTDPAAIRQYIHELLHRSDAELSRLDPSVLIMKRLLAGEAKDHAVCGGLYMLRVDDNTGKPGKPQLVRALDNCRHIATGVLGGDANTKVERLQDGIDDHEELDLPCRLLQELVSVDALLV